MERGLEDCHMGCNLEDATFLHSFFFLWTEVEEILLYWGILIPISSSTMYCCSRITHCAQLQGLSKISCIVGNCRWVIKRLTVLQISPSVYLLIYEILCRWTHKTTVWWLRSWGERGYLVPVLSQGVCHLPRSLRTRPCYVVPVTIYHPCDPITLTPMDGWTALAVCLPLGHGFIIWVGASALCYKYQSHLGQQGMGERSHLQLSAQDRTCMNQDWPHTTLGTDTSCPWWEKSTSLRVIACVCQKSDG